MLKYTSHLLTIFLIWTACNNYFSFKKKYEDLKLKTARTEIMSYYVNDIQIRVRHYAFPHTKPHHYCPECEVQITKQ